PHLCHRDLHSFPTRRSSDLTFAKCAAGAPNLSFYSKMTANSLENLRWRSRDAQHYRVSHDCSASGRAVWCSFRQRTRTAPLCRRSEEHTSELQSRFDLVCRL